MVSFSELVDDAVRTRALWKLITVLGTVELIGVPFFFVLGRNQAEFTSQVLLLFMYCGVTVGKCFAVRLLSEYEAHNVQEAVTQAIWAPETVPCLGTKLCWPKGATLLITTIPTYCETLVTAFALGIAGATWNEQQQDVWALSWTATPFGLLSFVGQFTLPSVLGVIVAIGFMMHVVSFVVGLERSRGAASLNSLEAVLMNASANIAGLMLVFTVIKTAQQLGAHEFGGTSGGEDALYPALGRVLVKFILGTQLRLYFKISMAGILLRTGANSKIVNAALSAVMLSFLHTLQLIYQIVCLIIEGTRVETCRNGCAISSEIIMGILAHCRAASRSGKCLYFCGGGCLCFFFFLPIICMIRFAGVMLCDTHVFNLSVWSCVGNMTGLGNATSLGNATI